MTKLWLNSMVRYQDVIMGLGYDRSQMQYEVVQKYWALHLLDASTSGQGKLSFVEIEAILLQNADEHLEMNVLRKAITKIHMLYDWAYELLGGSQ